MASQNYIELSVSINPLSVELITDYLITELGCSGVVMQEIQYEDEKVVSDTKGVVKAYIWENLDKPFNVEDVQDLLLQKRSQLIDCGISQENLGEWSLSVSLIEDEEWAHNWKKFWSPTKAGEKIVICPSWEEYEAQQGEIIIELDPGSAFGTGTHPTTRLCIQALEKYLSKDDRVADIGMGSGILSIAALKLGAKSVIGVDNDPSVVEVAIENAQNNGIKNEAVFYEGSAKDVEGQYEVVVANILAHILIDIMADLKQLIKKNGKIILSGIIKEKEQDVIKSAQSFGLEHVETLDEENWVAIVMA